MDIRKLAAECLGTAILVFIGVGVATVSFGSWHSDLLMLGGAGTSVAAGVVATALAFGLVQLVLAYALGPTSGCHINPAVTIGFVTSGRMSFGEGVSYWVAQFVGAIVAAAGLYGVFHSSTGYTSDTGLGTNGFGANSMIGVDWVGAFTAEAVLTFVFVLVVLSVTSRIGNSTVAALGIGFGLGAVHLLGIPITGTSVNPARSLGPALFAGGDALAQLWLFLAAPLVGGIIAALVHLYLVPADERATARG